MRTTLVKLVATAAATAAAVAARQAVEFGWREIRGQEPPTVADRGGDTQLRDLIVWTALIGSAVILARKVASDTTYKLLDDRESDGDS